MRTKKEVQSDKIGILFLSGDTTFGFEYWNNGFEGHNSLGGWLIFKEIEYLVFPQNFQHGQLRQHQCLEEVNSIVRSVGEFCLVREDDFLMLLCYQ